MNVMNVFTTDIVPGNYYDRRDVGFHRFGGFDLSIGSLVALTSVVTALITASHLTGTEATL